jgi:hypothetical protein
VHVPDTLSGGLQACSQATRRLSVRRASFGGGAGNDAAGTPHITGNSGCRVSKYLAWAEAKGQTAEAGSLPQPGYSPCHQEVRLFWCRASARLWLCQCGWWCGDCCKGRLLRNLCSARRRLKRRQAQHMQDLQQEAQLRAMRSQVGTLQPASCCRRALAQLHLTAIVNDET